MIGKHLKDYKKKYVAERKAQPRKVRIKKNSDWRKRWMPFIKYDHDFDGGFFLELIVHKLHIMLDYYDHGKYCAQVDESRLEIVESLRKACALGDALINDEFYDEAYAVMEKHMTVRTTDCEEHPGCKQLHFDWDSEADEQHYHELEKAAEDARKKAKEDFFRYIGEHYEEWWD
jgi:hypothetical protein